MSFQPLSVPAESSSVYGSTVGELADRSVTVDRSALCRAVDELFQADDNLRSVIVGPDGDSAAGLVNRSDFYQLLTGRRGYGWSLYSGRPVSDIIGEVRRPVVIAADRSVVEVGLELLARADLQTSDDILVCGDAGRMGQVAVSALLAEVARAHSTMVEEARAAERRFRSLLQGSVDVIGLVDRHGIVTYLSAAVERIVGYHVADRVGRSVFDLLHPDDVEPMRSLFDSVLSTPDAESPLAFRLQRQDGEWRRMDGNARNLLHDEAVNGIVVNFRDVTERHLLQEQLRHQAFHDSLTGLPNRQLIKDRAEQMLARGRRQRQACAAMLIDLDGFKHVNDLYGHGAGDLLLCLVAERLRLTLRASDTVGRLGGDEFVALVEGTSLDAGPDLVAERILGVFRTPFRVEGRSLNVTASIGTAIGEGVDVADLLRNADIALYQAKGAGRNRHAVFSPSMKQAVEKRGWLSADLPGALERGEFLLHFQPAFGLRDGRVRGVEALIRWKHPERGLISPAEFIPSLEESGLIVAVGRWVLSESCRVASVLQSEDPSFSVSVNVSGRQLDEEDQVLRDVVAALEASRLPAHRLTLEITESILMRDAESTARQLRRLKEIGVRIAIDDFGTGYSSLAYLASFPIDAFKVDRSFVANLGRSDEADCLLQGVLNLGRALSLVTVAEGIEDEHQLEVLRSHGCDLGQGFKLARPMPLEELRELLAVVNSRLAQ